MESTQIEIDAAWQGSIRNAVPLAIQTIIEIMGDPKCSPSLRIRAAGMILKLASVKPATGSAKPEIVHNSAQSCTIPTIRKTVEPARNTPCPCGSGMKFKRCCSQNPLPLAA